MSALLLSAWRRVRDWWITSRTEVEILKRWPQCSGCLETIQLDEPRVKLRIEYSHDRPECLDRAEYF